MTSTASGAVAATRALNALARDDRGRLLAALIGRFRDFSLAEDALQDAMIEAVGHWSRSGVPASPTGWLLTVASRKALDRIRNRQAQTRLADALQPLTGDEAGETDSMMPAAEIPDERLRLIFTCCHPALEPKSRIALTLRTLGGLSTGEIARSFLDEEATMGQRLSRAKAKIAAARIPYKVPEPEEWSDRLDAVLAVIYLVFTAGHGAGPRQGRDLADEALYLCRTLDQLKPAEPEIEGCLALLLLSHSRRAARLDANGVTIALSRQDRSLWDRRMIRDGLPLVERALRRGRPGPYQIKAAIAACHCEGETSDWAQIAALYGVLFQHEPTPIVRLNRAVAIAEAGDLGRALDEIESLNASLSRYQPYHAARAELLARGGRTSDAKAAYGRAITLAASEADAAFLSLRLDALPGEVG